MIRYIENDEFIMYKYIICHIKTASHGRLCHAKEEINSCARVEFRVSAEHPYQYRGFIDPNYKPVINRFLDTEDLDKYYVIKHFTDNIHLEITIYMAT